MQIVIAKSDNQRRGSYSYKGLRLRLEKSGITNYRQPKDCSLVYFECTREQYDYFRRRMYIYAGFMPWMYNTAAKCVGQDFWLERFGENWRENCKDLNLDLQ